LSIGAAEQKAASSSPDIAPQEQKAALSDTAAASSTAQDEFTKSAAELRNRASDSNSPYIRSHATSPVKWQLLDSEAVSRAQRENKLIFLNVGFRACHCMSAAPPPSSSFLLLINPVYQTIQLT